MPKYMLCSAHLDWCIFVWLLSQLLNEAVFDILKTIPVEKVDWYVYREIDKADALAKPPDELVVVGGAGDAARKSQGC